MRPMMNLRELAQHLGLSQTTVSRALNGFPEVGEATRRRVVEAAARFHYRPNASARTLATGRASAIGIVFGPERNLLVDQLFTDFLAGLAERAAATDTDIVVSSAHGSEEATYRRLARRGSVDAVVLSSPTIEDPRLALLEAVGLPVVMHGRTRAARPYAHLDIDNRGAFMSAAGMLADLGHRRIGLVNGEAALAFAAERRAGWEAALVARSLAADPALAANAAMTEENGYRLTQRLMGLGEPPTAILCASIFMALGAMRAARDLGLAIGRDLSLVAHDDGIEAIRPETLSPALTTTVSSIRAAGSRIAELALALVGGEPVETLAEVWPVELVYRDSTRPPLTPR
jgi:LacI family transcriptional regulator